MKASAPLRVVKIFALLLALAFSAAAEEKPRNIIFILSEIGRAHV